RGSRGHRRDAQPMTRRGSIAMLRSRAIATAVFAALPLLAACARHADPVEDVRPVRTLTVGAPPASAAANYSGEIKARHDAVLGFQVGGRIQQRLVEVGDSVKVGTPLMKLDPVDTSLSAQAALAQVNSARSSVAQYRNDLARYEALAQKNYVGKSDL